MTDNKQIKMSDKKISNLIAQMCYYPTTTNESKAVQLFFEKMCLPKYKKWYTIEMMEKYIMYFIKNKKMFEPTPSKTKI